VVRLSNGPLHDLRLAVERIKPVYQKLDGPQLEQDWILVVGAQYTIDLGPGHKLQRLSETWDSSRP